VAPPKPPSKSPYVLAPLEKSVLEAALWKARYYAALKDLRLLDLQAATSEAQGASVELAAILKSLNLPESGKFDIAPDGTVIPKG